MGRGGHRVASPGKTIGRPAKTSGTIARVRVDVAIEIIGLINTPEKKRDLAVKKASPEARLAYTKMMEADKRLWWDMYRYYKECVDDKPKKKSEDGPIFDPDKPLRVLIDCPAEAK